MGAHLCHTCPSRQPGLLQNPVCCPFLPWILVPIALAALSSSIPAEMPERSCVSVLESGKGEVNRWANASVGEDPTVVWMWELWHLRFLAHGMCLPIFTG